MGAVENQARVGGMREPSEEVEQVEVAEEHVARRVLGQHLDAATLEGFFDVVSYIKFERLGA